MVVNSPTMKIRSYTVIILVFFILPVIKMKAQDQVARVKEFGIGLYNLNSYFLQYRWGNEKRLVRFSGNIGGVSSLGKSSDNSITEKDTVNSGTTATTNNTIPINLNAGLSFSLLKIKMLSDKFGIMYGGISTISYWINKSNTDRVNGNNGLFGFSSTVTTRMNSQTIQPSLGIVIGGVYKISPVILLYVEIDPNIYYSYKKDDTTIITNSVNSSKNGNVTYIKTEVIPATTSSFGLSNVSNSGASLTFVYRITK